jgi:predicted amidohydrolase
MKITVCELKNELDLIEQEWQNLVNHVKAEQSDLVLLPEMPFYPWIAQTNMVDTEIWKDSVAKHTSWISRLIELSPAVVASSSPVINQVKHLNEAFIWEKETGYKAAHHKYYLPEEEGWWEASWYERGERDFKVIQSSRAKIGFLICTELWFNQHAREYSKQGIELLLCPRATGGGASTDKWIAGGRTAAVVSGAYCLSSNYSRKDVNSVNWGGSGWIIDPEGKVLGVTSSEQPFLTLEIDLIVAETAKQTYPRYVLD